jgi:CAAX prenyl protease-like protein
MSPDYEPLSQDPQTSEDLPEPRDERVASSDSTDLFPYVLPMCAYVGLGGFESYLPSANGMPSAVWYPLAYTVKVAVVALLAWRFRSTWSDFRPRPTFGTLLLAVTLGLLVWVLWIGLDGLYPALPLMGKRVGFDVAVMAPGARWAFVAVRMVGLVVLVPVIEELFWRSFLMRWLIDPDFRKVPIGRVTPLAAAATSGLFALVHPEWLPALVTGLLWAWLLWKTKSLGACAISHATANLALGLYVMATGNWKYW